MEYRDHVDANPKVFTIWPFSKKSLPSPDLEKKYCLSHKEIAFFFFLMSKLEVCLIK